MYKKHSIQQQSLLPITKIMDGTKRTRVGTKIMDRN